MLYLYTKTFYDKKTHEKSHKKVIKTTQKVMKKS